MLEASKQEKILFDSGAFYYLKHNAGRFDLLPPFGLIRVALRCEKGVDKYSEENQFRGIPIKHHICSSLRHIIKYMAGDKSEDHLAAAAQRLLAAIDVEEKFKMGLLTENYVKLSSWCLLNPSGETNSMIENTQNPNTGQTVCCSENRQEMLINDAHTSTNAENMCSSNTSDNEFVTNTLTTILNESNADKLVTMITDSSLTQNGNKQQKSSKSKQRKSVISTKRNQTKNKNSRTTNRQSKQQNRSNVKKLQIKNKSKMLNVKRKQTSTKNKSMKNISTTNKVSKK